MTSYDENAIPSDQIDVTINGPRTPFNLASAMVALADELRDLDGPDGIETVLRVIAQDNEDVARDLATA